MKYYNVYNQLIDIYKKQREYVNPGKWYSNQITVSFLSIGIALIVYFTMDYVCNAIFQLSFELDTRLYTTAIIFLSFIVTCNIFKVERKKNNLKKLIRREKLDPKTSDKEVLYPRVCKGLLDADLLYGSNKDLELIKYYILVLEKEQQKIPTKPNQILGLGIIIAILAPLWNKIIEEILESTHHSLAGYGVCLIFSIVIIYASYALNPLRDMYFKWIHAKRIDITDMINCLYEIQIEMEINYTKAAEEDVVDTQENVCGLKWLITYIRKFFGH